MQLFLQKRAVSGSHEVTMTAERTSQQRTNSDHWSRARRVFGLRPGEVLWQNQWLILSLSTRCHSDVVMSDCDTRLEASGLWTDGQTGLHHQPYETKPSASRSAIAPLADYFPS